MFALTVIVFPVFTAGFVAGKTPGRTTRMKPLAASNPETGRGSAVGRTTRKAGTGGVFHPSSAPTLSRGLYRGHTAAHWAARYRHRTRQLMAVRRQVRQLKQQLRRRHTSAASASSNTAYGVWDRLADCESGGDWGANTGNGFFGGLQWTLGTWSAHGGQGMPNLASRGTQIAVAERVLAAAGGRFTDWPGCRAKLGLP